MMSLKVFQEPTAFSTMTKRAGDYQKIDESTYADYLEINPEEISFDKTAFEHNILYPMKENIKEEEYEYYVNQVSFIENTSKKMTEHFFRKMISQKK